MSNDQHEGAGNTLPPLACSGVPFRQGVDCVLDLAAGIGGKVTDLKVVDIAPGVVDLYATVSIVVPRSIENIEVKFAATGDNTPTPLDGASC